MYLNNNGSSMSANTNDFNTSIEDLTAADLDLIDLDDYSDFYKLMSNVSASALSASSFQPNNYTVPTFLPNYANYAPTNNNHLDLINTPSMSLPLGMKLPIMSSQSCSTNTSNSSSSHTSRKRPHSPQVEDNNNNRLNMQCHTTPSTSSTAMAANINDQRPMNSTRGSTTTKKLRSINSKDRQPHLHPNYHQQYHQNTDHRININSKLTPMPSLSQQQQQSTSSSSLPSRTISKYDRHDDMPCWVCGEFSSGHHYGAMSCEACKLFFRRNSNAIENQQSILMWQCADRNCLITFANRSSCSECRFRKCIAVGMGPNRTMFGRHTYTTKSKNNAKSYLDLPAEIRRLFEALKRTLEKSHCPISLLSRSDLANLLFPINNSSMINFNNSSFSTHNPFQLFSTNGSNMQQKEQLIVLKSELESKLIDFYNEVIDLIQHQWKTPNRYPLPYDLLVTFCLMFGCNLLNNDSRNTSRNFKLDEGYEGKQMRLIISQVREIEEKFDRFADRVKIIYFLLIMYMSYGPIASRDDFFTFYFSEETNEVHRTLLDLLNSELIDFRNNNVSSLRISLLLKLDQFV